MIRLLIKLIFWLVLLWVILKCIGNPKDLISAPIRVAQGISAGVELRNVERMLIYYQTMNEGRLPRNQEEFERFMRGRFESNVKDPLLDFWGHKYQYKRTGDGFEVRSFGPDKRAFSDDDIVMTWRKRNG